MPEVFATWSVARSEQITAGVTSAMGDHGFRRWHAFAAVYLALIGLVVFWIRPFGGS